MPLYSVDQILGKTLVAKAKVPLYRFPYPNAEIVGNVEPGGYVGLVYAWLDADPANGRNEMWWSFAPAAGTSNYYYTPHREGVFHIAALKEQGVITTEERIKQELEKKRLENQPWYMTILNKSLPWIAGIAIAVVAVPELIRRKK